MKTIGNNSNYCLPLSSQSSLCSVCSCSFHRLHPGGVRGEAVRDLPALRRGQLRPQLLLHSLLRRTHGVPGPGVRDRGGGADLDHGSEVLDGGHQRRGQPGQAAAHPRPVSFSSSRDAVGSALKVWVRLLFLDRRCLQVAETDLHRSR